MTRRRWALAGLGAKRQVVGHTVQAKGITAACDDTIWRIDVGLAKIYDGPIEVLELEDLTSASPPPPTAATPPTTRSP